MPRIVAISRQKENLYLVFDQGGHATRALVFDDSSDIIFRAESEISTTQKGELIVEHDPKQLIASVFHVLAAVEDFLGGDFTRIAAAGLATQRSSFVCWDKKTGDALTPIISWQDRRAVNELSRYEYAEAVIHKKTGLYLNPHYGATKINWCLRNEATVQAYLKANELCIAPLASFILFHLLKGSPFKVDPANASRTLLMNYKRLVWDRSLLDIFGVPGSLLPTIEGTVAEYGYLNCKNGNIPLKVCTGDQSAAIFVNGMPGVKELYVNIGTGAFVQQYSQHVPIPAEEKMLASVVYAEQGKRSYVVEGTVNGAARALDWLAERSGVVDYQTQLAAWDQMYEEPPVFLNGISGVGSPFWHPKLTSRFLSDAAIGAQFIGVLESIVFLIYRNILAIRKMGYESQSVEISGGLSNSNVICQKLSNLSRMMVRRAPESEATARGVYFLLSGASQKNDEANYREFIPLKNNLLVARYECWLEAMNSACRQYGES